MLWPLFFVLGGTCLLTFLVAYSPGQHFQAISGFFEILDHHEGSVVGLGTLALVVVTGFLWYSTKKLWEESVRAGKTAEKAADAARDSAHAAVVASMPILQPWVTVFRHPPIIHLPESANPLFTFDAPIRMVFRNYGKTPAAIREVRAELFLVRDGTLPEPMFDNLPIREYSVMVPGEQTTNEVEAALSFNKTFIVPQDHFQELLSEADGVTPCRRIYLLGKVIYDDFFGVRHDRKFCLKLRLTFPHNFPSLFQVQKGEREYNDIQRTQTPQS